MDKKTNTYPNRDGSRKPFAKAPRTRKFSGILGKSGENRSSNSSRSTSGYQSRPKYQDRPRYQGKPDYRGNSGTNERPRYQGRPSNVARPGYSGYTSRTGYSSTRSSYSRLSSAPSVYSSQRNSYGRRPSSGGYGQPRYSRGGNGGGRKSTLDVSMLTKKAIGVAEKAEYTPVNLFSDFKIAQILKESIILKGYVKPTPIQDQAIPQILEGKNLVGIANTGTGKTAAFLVPIINKIIENPSTKALIVLPTRELAVQINQELQSLTKNLRIHAVTCIGGASMREQIMRFKRQHNLVIGTPGRLKDLTNRGILRLNQFNIVVLDEVDRMLDMGFIHDIKFLVEKLPEQRQSLFFSATINPAVQQVIKIFAQDHVTVSVKSASTSDNVNQDIIRVSSQEEKSAKLLSLLNEEATEKAIIFVRTKHGADRLANNLYQKGIRVDCIHGDKRQNQRQQAITKFKSGVINVLVATDVAARGLDISGITHVINYDLPATHDDYAHRIGRTGRGGKIGHAFTFVG